MLSKQYSQENVIHLKVFVKQPLIIGHCRWENNKNKIEDSVFRKLDFTSAKVYNEKVNLMSNVDKTNTIFKILSAGYH